MINKTLLMLMCMASLLSAKEFPAPAGRVNDFAGILTESSRQELGRLSMDVDHATTAELAVVTVSSLKGDSVEALSNRLFREWGIGKKEKNNGVLILVAPHERKMRIEVGYGLEPTLPDGLAGEVIREQMVPAFKVGDYNRGIMDGAKRVADILRANQPAPHQTQHEDDDVKGPVTPLASIGVAVFFSVFVGLGFFMFGAGLGSKTFFPLLWGSFFGGIPLVMALSGTMGIVPRYFLPFLALGVSLWGLRTGKKPKNFLSSKRLTGRHTDGWTFGSTGGSGSSSGGGGGGFSGGSSGGGGSSGSW